MSEHKPLPDFKSYEERDNFFRERADYYTCIKKDGVGLYQRDECKTLEEAVSLAQTRRAVGGGRFMIYAVIGEQSAFVRAIG